METQNIINIYSRPCIGQCSSWCTGSQCMLAWQTQPQCLNPTPYHQPQSLAAVGAQVVVVGLATTLAAMWQQVRPNV
jgi:hypothetical protein